jgi:ankyrin repeat protein
MELPGGTAFHFDSNGGNTALHMAAYAGGAAVIRELLAAGADVGATNHRGDTPLHFAAIQVSGRSAGQGSSIGSSHGA